MNSNWEGTYNAAIIVLFILTIIYMCVKIKPKEDNEVVKKEDDLARKKRISEAPERMIKIRKFYENKMNVCRWTTGDLKFTDNVYFNNNWVVSWFKINFSLARSLSSLTQREADILLYTELLYTYGIITDKENAKIHLAIIYNGGNCDKTVLNSEGPQLFLDKNAIKSDSDMIKYVANCWSCESSNVGVSLFLSIFSRKENIYHNKPIIREIKAKILGGNNWFSDNEVSGSIFDTNVKNDSVFLGEMETSTPIWYSQEGSLITIAPPGSGKTQCHVFPNLVSYHGPVVILDVKGECYDKTSQWRKQHVGPVFKFNPLSPSDSARYNPLALISDDPDLLWEECRLMADLLIVPENLNDPSWENRARDVIAGIIAWLVLHNPPERRSMGKVVDVVSKVGWDKFIEDSKYTMEISALSRLGNSLAAMPDKQLEGVLDAARRHLAVWEGSRVEKVTDTCDWTPDVLRNGSNSTIYICIPPNEIESYAPLLRVLFAQHLRHLLKQLPPPGQKTILFMLDELPRLGTMKPVEEALEVGRQYGIRLWMFAQSLGQLEKAYTNANGMIGSCAVRIFMNPSAHDGTAKRLSEELGYTESIIDGSRQLMVEPNDLVGPDYANYQLVFARDTRPAKLKKVFAYNNPEFSGKLLWAGS